MAHPHNRGIKVPPKEWGEIKALARKEGMTIPQLIMVKVLHVENIQAKTRDILDLIEDIDTIKTNVRAMNTAMKNGCSKKLTPGNYSAIETAAIKETEEERKDRNEIKDGQ
jgi:hypothetical protein